jgi:hypothetical protein
MFVFVKESGSVSPYSAVALYSLPQMTKLPDSHTVSLLAIS